MREYNEYFSHNSSLVVYSMQADYKWCALYISFMHQSLWCPWGQMMCNLGNSDKDICTYTHGILTWHYRIIWTMVNRDIAFCNKSRHGPWEMWGILTIYYEYVGIRTIYYEYVGIRTIYYEYVGIRTYVFCIRIPRVCPPLGYPMDWCILHEVWLDTEWMVS